MLPLTLLILLVLATLVSALLATGTSEPQITANLTRGAQALGLAEGGVERAAAYFAQNASVVQSVCPGGCSGAQPTTTLWSAQAMGAGTYTVTYQPVGVGTVLVDSVGQAAGGSATRHVQAIVTSVFSTKDAILAHNVSLSGDVTVNGGLGSAHSNTDASLSGSAHVGVTVTTTGTTCTNCTDSAYVGDPVDSGTGKPEQYIPPVNPTDPALIAKADYVLRPDGTILVTATAVVVAAGSGQFGGWGADRSGNWTFSGSATPPNGTYYVGTTSPAVVSSISINASPGTVTTPWQATFIGNDVAIQGHPVIAPALGDTVIVANQVDLKGTGGAASLTGTVLSHGDVNISGGVTLTGNIIAEGTVGVIGSTTITYGKKNHTPIFIAPTVISWSTLSQ